MPFGQSPAQRIILCALLSNLVGSVWASPGDQDLIRDRQNRLLEDQQRRLDDLRNLPGQPSIPAVPKRPEDRRCFTIRTIELKGAASISASSDPLIRKSAHGRSPICLPGPPTLGPDGHRQLAAERRRGGVQRWPRHLERGSGFKPGTITKYQQYYDKQGDRLKYEAGQWKAWE